jgi:serine/threonine protein kinase
MSDLIGQVLLNQFRVEASISVGGMGTVYRVWDLKRGVALAMKVLHSDLIEDAISLKRFQHEANFLKKLRHPNIVPFYGLYQTGNISFFLEGYIDGPTLREILRQRQENRLSITEALTCLKSICAALGYAHYQGIVHCDVKPSNVIVDRGGSIFITDFGISQHAESNLTTLAAGTPAYIAPEQLMGLPVAKTTDIYSLGIMFYEILTGQRPFTGSKALQKGNSRERIRYEQLNLHPQNPKKLNPALPPELAEVILKALAKNPVERYQSAQEFFMAACKGAGIERDRIPDRLSSVSSDRASTTNLPSTNLVLQSQKPEIKADDNENVTEVGYSFDEKIDSRTIAENAWFVVIKGVKKGIRIEVNKERISIGRSPECDIFLPDSSVSRLHGQIRYINGNFTLWDMSSKYGIKVNNTRIRAATILNDGDAIQCGDNSIILFRPTDHQLKISQLWDELSSGLY